MYLKKLEKFVKILSSKSLKQEAPMRVIWQAIVDYSVLTIFHVENLMDEYQTRAAAHREERKHAHVPNG